ncbi:MAG TPA: hypothetical protein VH165_13220 [Kofleriaceae bacterium]|nr:hypothetical protein [Kofleriaceae bacterium]
MAIAQAADAAIASFPEEQQMLYSALIESALSAAARKAFAMLVGEKRKNFLERQYDRHYERGIAEGKAGGKIEALLQLLASRELTLNDDQRQRIMSCTQLETIDRWLASVLSVASVDELLGPR